MAVTDREGSAPSAAGQGESPAEPGAERATHPAMPPRPPAGPRRRLLVLLTIPLGILVLAAAAIISARAISRGPADDQRTGPPSSVAAPQAGAGSDGPGPVADRGGAAQHDHGDEHSVVVDDKGLSMLKNGHHETMVYTQLSPEDQAGLDHLLAVNQEVVQRYPTLGSFKAAGAMRAGPFSPGLGAHYVLVTVDSFNPDGVMDETDIRNPLSIIFDGPTDDAKIAGFMYYSAAPSQPVGFPGPNDFWHYHTDVCQVRNSRGEVAAISADGSVTPAVCEELGGLLMKQTQWMVHVWSVPGYEVAQEDGGVFAEVNPKLTCPDGSYRMMTDPKDLMEHTASACLSELGA